MPTLGMVCRFDADEYPGIYNSCNVLVEHGWDVDVLCLDLRGFGGRSFDPRVRLHRIPGQRRAVWRLYVGARSVAKTYKWDFAIGHDMYGFVICRLCRVLPPERVALWSQDLADPSRFSWGQRLLYQLKRMYLHSCPLVIVPSQTRGAALKQFFSPDLAPVVVYNSPPLEVQAPDEGWRRRLGIAANVPMVVYAGGLGRDRCVPELVESVALWPTPSVLVMAGYGRPGMIEELWRISGRCGTSRRVFFVGHLPSIFGLVREAQLGVSLFSSDAQDRNGSFRGIASNKIFEYLALGKPAVVGHNPETAAFMARFGCGLCIREPSPRNIAAAVNRFLSDEGFLRRASRAALSTHRLETHFERRFTPLLWELQSQVEKSAALPGRFPSRKTALPDGIPAGDNAPSRRRLPGAIRRA